MAEHLFPEEWHERPAVVVEPSGKALTFGELEHASNKAAHLFRTQGIMRGDTIALVMENRLEFLVLAWAAQRSGLYYVAVNNHLTPPEVAYVVTDSGARAVYASAKCASRLSASSPGVRYFQIDPGAHAGWEPARWDDEPESPIADQAEGDFLLYSSGTTGRPKGIQRPLIGSALGTYPDLPGAWLTELLGLRVGDTFLSPAPLYHAAPLGWSMGALRRGASVVIMERFDPTYALALIARHRVTHSQWVPTMFIRMLKLDEAVRRRFDLSSHRVAVHAAAPCPVAAKRAMIDWWGPILFEFYSATEGIGATSIFADEWLKKPGSVGKPLLGTPVVLDDAGNPVKPGVVGTIWFSGGREFSYHDDPVKTAAAIDAQGRATVGDVGWIDDDGYLYLSDRRAHLIISGGVNIYPQEVENTLVMHPEVHDVAVAGVPDPDLGERVVAYVQVAPNSADGALAERLQAYCAQTLARFKIPREFRVVRSLPRTPTGKLRKHELPM
ncbi:MULTISPECIES: AMP-binding protein [Actinomycetes]|uniref:AMP-binding protein n=1 Tax=Actinomycetes TaxID=1760 RepID=UPI0009DFD50C|nr:MULTISPECIES: AMP-binding protein [Actinomycetes]